MLLPNGLLVHVHPTLEKIGPGGVTAVDVQDVLWEACGRIGEVQGSTFYVRSREGETSRVASRDLEEPR